MDLQKRKGGSGFFRVTGTIVANAKTVTLTIGKRENKRFVRVMPKKEA